LKVEVAASQGETRDARRILAERARRTSATVILEEVTRLLPDAAFLQQLCYERDKVDLVGYANSAVALLPIFERSEFFHDARLTAPVVRDSGEKGERFGIRLLLRNAAPKQAGDGLKPSGGGK
jgi:general secretion pathway protein L